MHLLVRQEKDLDEQAVAQDLDLPSADIVVLSFSESDLLSVITAEHCIRERESSFPSIQVTDLSRLRHPMSVDVYIEKTLSEAQCVVIRLLGGLETWRYGIQEILEWGDEEDCPVILLPGHHVRHNDESKEDSKEEARKISQLHQFQDLSTVDREDWKKLYDFFDYGGQDNMIAALGLLGRFCGYHSTHIRVPQKPRQIPLWGIYRHIVPSNISKIYRTIRALVVFYRSHLLSGDVDGIDKLGDVLAGNGCDVHLVYVSSLKVEQISQELAQYIQKLAPDILINGTCFSTRNHAGFSPFDAADVPVIQILQPGSTQALWEKSLRGLSFGDLAMQSVLPELDGVVEAFPISFRGQASPGLPAQREAYIPGIEMTVSRAMGWAHLRLKENAQKNVAIILSDYPGASLQPGSAHVAHAVGLDGFASLSHILQILGREGYTIGHDDQLFETSNLVKNLTNVAPKKTLSLYQYRQFFSQLDLQLQKKITQQWGVPQNDKNVDGGYFVHRFLTLGHVTVAVQPLRADLSSKKDSYHDQESYPSHHYIAFYFWLTKTRKIDAMIHLGTHGTVEWLPGKAVAMSPTCLPAILVGRVPVIYPFIVNNPGEAAAARRRLGAVMIGHMTPPIMRAGLNPAMTQLEQLIDEYSQAQGLDKRRCDILQKRILDKAIRTGLLEESGVRVGQSINEEQALTVLDSWLCDVKEMQIREGLHIFGKNPPKRDVFIEMIKEAGNVDKDMISDGEIARRLSLCGPSEITGLLRGLSGRHVTAGPAGAPTRGRIDVLPTGRNLYTVDPRILPTQSAYKLSAAMEEQLLTTHLQKEGEPLRHLVMDLWGSASLRTGGEDLALAFRLMGVKLKRVKGTGRLRGFEIIPLIVLKRPRVDVTLRISGLFRDMFEEQIALFDQVVEAIAAQESEPDEDNPLAASVRGREGESYRRATARVFGGRKGSYGTGIEEKLLRGNFKDREELGQSWIRGSEWTYGGRHEGFRDTESLKHILKDAQTVIHTQDHGETDILDSTCNSAHEGGIAAAVQTSGGDAQFLHGDTSSPSSPRLRDSAAEIARVVRGRLSNPKWIKAMQKHGYAGAAEMALGLDVLYGFSATLPQRLDRQFELVFDATIGDPQCYDFLQKENPAACQAMINRFEDAVRRGLWHPKSNRVAFELQQKRVHQ